MYKKILITGTGRCGTTFLIKIFSFLKLDTGYTKENFQNNIFTNCNSGMESDFKSEHRYLKNPTFMMIDIDKIHTLYGNDVLFIVPIRSFEESAKSRVSHKNYAGGLFHANNFNEQVAFYYNTFSNFLRKITKNDINTIFIDFDRMVSDKMYLYKKLENIFSEENVSFESFSKEFDFATNIR